MFSFCEQILEIKLNCAYYLIGILEMEDVDEMVRKVNSTIRDFKLEIRKGVDEGTQVTYYALVNLVDNAITRLSSLYKPIHLEYFKKVVAALVVSPNGCISFNCALNLTQEITDHIIKISEADSLLEKWLEEKYLAKTKDNCNLYLGARSTMELDLYLKEYLPQNVKECNLCKFICIRGTCCEFCSAKLHSHCAEKYFSRIQVCPNCGKTRN